LLLTFFQANQVTLKRCKIDIPKNKIIFDVQEIILEESKITTALTNKCFRNVRNLLLVNTPMLNLSEKFPNLITLVV
jgi:hypothetical protein